MDHNRKLYIETVGCQMNMLDSELVVAALRRHGYELTADVHEADTVLFNTCSVREHAEHKIYSQLGRLKFSKRRRPRQVIGVLGCMAQKDQERIFQRAPHVDLVVGTGQLSEVPRLIEEARDGRRRAVAVSLSRKEGTRLGSLRELSKLRSAPRAGHAALAVSGLRADHDRLRQVLHVLRRPHDARTGAEPPSCRHRRRGPRAGRTGGQGSHPAGADGQQLQVHRERPALPAERSARADSRHARHRPHQVRHQLPARHVGRFAVLPSATCRKSAATCTCRPSRDRTTCCG